MSRKQFGGKPTPDLLKRYAESSNWADGKFQNLVETKMEFDFRSIPKLLYKQLFEKKNREPAQPLPVAAFDKTSFLDDLVPFKYIWYGHSAVLIRLNGQTLLIDPMMGPNAAPISPFPVKRFSKNTLDFIGDWPEIDVLLLTHDHYDHLDLASIQLLKGKVKKYAVALGCKRHLTHWGVQPDLVEEYDWWDDFDVGDIHITFTPSRHFSGRGLKDRAKSLWGGWVLQTPTQSIYFSGDGGYGEHFKEVGLKLGPFDFGFMECGQYNENWHAIHMYPEESVQAGIDAQVKKAMPVHWAGFSLAPHSWTDPAIRFCSKALNQGLNTISPEMGKLYTMEDQPETTWWL